MTSPNIDPPDDLPEDITEMLEASSDSQLRDIIHYAQRLPGEHPPLTDAIEPREGEEILRIDDHDVYTSVIVERPDETGSARGPFAYRVKWEPEIEGDGGHYWWHYLGRVDIDSGGE
ncbi:hypothetical protein [Halovenus salina]|uniref:hypothetical protein n=1 Tax=Halovenus salina TaxID=1510225 RepID=UPI00226091F5|nr:hypothetical protein [Halovenus salina]